MREVGRFAHNFLRVADDGIVVGMLLGQLVEHGGRDFLLVVQRGLVGVREIFFVKRERGFVDRLLGLRQIGLGALHDLFHRQVGSESEAQFLAELVSAEPEITVRAREQIFLQPCFVFFECDGRFLLERREVLLRLRRADRATGSRPSRTNEIAPCICSIAVSV